MPDKTFEPLTLSEKVIKYTNKDDEINFRNNKEF